jgi:phosphoribosylformimino-5-aminoimidazole carboxamide ribotide isomerase
MLVIPAIDIRHGQCVRLHKGMDSESTIYGEDPVAMAQTWKSQGAKMLHIIDLDGAFDGTPVNLKTLARIRQETGLPVQVGGGYRDMDSIQAAVDAGIDRIILGTVAVKNPKLVRDAAQKFAGHIMVGIDVREGFVAVSGWTEIDRMTCEDLVPLMRDAGIHDFLFTDTQKDGTLSGPNLEAIRDFLRVAQCPVIVAGGVTTVDDLRALRQLEPQGLKGAIIGKSLYDKRIRLEDALQAVA